MHGRGRGLDVVTGEHGVGTCRASFVHRSDLDVGREEGDRPAHESRRSGWTVDGRRIAARAGPLMREQRGHVRRVVVVQVGEAYAANVQVAQACLHQGAQRAVSAVHQIRPAVHDHRARGFPAAEVDDGTSLRAEEHEHGPRRLAGRRRGRGCAGRLRLNAVRSRQGGQERRADARASRHRDPPERAAARKGRCRIHAPILLNRPPAVTRAFARPGHGG